MYYISTSYKLDTLCGIADLYVYTLLWLYGVIFMDIQFAHWQIITIIIMYYISTG